MKEIENFKKVILDEYPRLSEQSSFCFSCHKGISCFNKCCGDVNIFLTPYDILRLKNNLGITSEEFLRDYTLLPFDENLKYPVILLKMNDDELKSCPFVTQEGCSVYPDRPWSCRMYPLGLASPKENSAAMKQEFYFLLKEPDCKGFEIDKELTISQWLIDQGISKYNELGEYFKNLTLHSYFEKKGKLTPEKVEMFFLACYNLDKFREFLFETSFFSKFEVSEEIKNQIKADDEALLKFGHTWLHFALFGEKSMTIRNNILEAKKRDL